MARKPVPRKMTPKMKRPRGRPRVPEELRAAMIDAVLVKVASGIPVKRAVVGIVGYVTFWQWHGEDVGLQERLAQARMVGIELDMEEIKLIADEKGVDPQDKRVRIYARELRARMLAPRKYGPKLDLTTGGDKLQMDDVSMAIRAASIISAALKRGDAAMLGEPDDGAD
jgi:adenine-specific DNA methylase